jgi:hypothetical protein
MYYLYISESSLQYWAWEMGSVYRCRSCAIGEVTIPPLGEVLVEVHTCVQQTSLRISTAALVMPISTKQVSLLCSHDDYYIETEAEGTPKKQDSMGKCQNHNTERKKPDATGVPTARFHSYKTLSRRYKLKRQKSGL